MRGATMEPVGEQFNLFIAMVTTPDGERLVVEGQRPKLGPGDALLVVRSVVGAVRYRETLDPMDDLDVRVAQVASGLEAGDWPPELR